MKWFSTESAQFTHLSLICRSESVLLSILLVQDTRHPWEIPCEPFLYTIKEGPRKHSCETSISTNILIMDVSRTVTTSLFERILPSCSWTSLWKTPVCISYSLFITGEKIWPLFPQIKNWNYDMVACFSWEILHIWNVFPPLRSLGLFSP